MPFIIYKSHHGATQEVQTEVGTSIMQAAVENGIDGILGECGEGESHIYRTFK